MSNYGSNNVLDLVRSIVNMFYNLYSKVRTPSIQSYLLDCH